MPVMKLVHTRNKLKKNILREYINRDEHPQETPAAGLSKTDREIQKKALLKARKNTIKRNIYPVQS